MNMLINISSFVKVDYRGATAPKKINFPRIQ